MRLQSPSDRCRYVPDRFDHGEQIERGAGFLRGEGGYRGVFGGFCAADTWAGQGEGHTEENNHQCFVGARLAGARPSG